jgi:hypothetical protein
LQLRFQPDGNDRRFHVLQCIRRHTDLQDNAPA